MSNVAPGWYRVPGAETSERYFNGSMWMGKMHKTRAGTAAFPDQDDADLADVEPQSYEDRMIEVAEAQLVEQRRSANYLAILTYITVILLVLAVVVAVGGAIIAAKT